MVDVAQLVRAADCGSVGRGFEPHLPPSKKNFPDWKILFYYLYYFRLSVSYPQSTCLIVII